MEFVKYGNLESYLEKELTEASSIKKSKIEEEKEKVKKLKGAVYKIEISNYYCKTDEEFKQLEEILDDYHKTQTNAILNTRNHLEELEELGFKIVRYPYVTEFEYLGKYWIVYYSHDENFSVKELNEYIHTNRQFAIKSLIECAHLKLMEHNSK